MFAQFSFALEVLATVLLAVMIIYAVRLNRTLVGLQTDREELDQSGVHPVILEACQDDSFDSIGSNIEAAVTCLLIAGRRAAKEVQRDLGVIAVAEAAL